MERRNPFDFQNHQIIDRKDVLSSCNDFTLYIDYNIIRVVVGTQIRKRTFRKFSEKPGTLIRDNICLFEVIDKIATLVIEDTAGSLAEKVQDLRNCN